MIETTIIRYVGCNIEVPEFLAPLWPYELPIDKWPTFCGAGDGWGDRAVPDSICGVRIACICYEHDISWAITDGSFSEFMKSNLRLYCNARSLVLPRVKWWQRWWAESKCFFYFSGTCVLGHKVFLHQVSDSKYYEDNFDNPAVKEKLHRLAMATLDYPHYKN